MFQKLQKKKKRKKRKEKEKSLYDLFHGRQAYLFGSSVCKCRYYTNYFSFILFLLSASKRCNKLYFCPSSYKIAKAL